MKCLTSSFSSSAVFRKAGCKWALPTNLVHNLACSLDPFSLSIWASQCIITLLHDCSVQPSFEPAQSVWAYYFSNSSAFQKHVRILLNRQAPTTALKKSLINQCLKDKLGLRDFNPKCVRVYFQLRVNKK